MGERIPWIKRTFDFDLPVELWPEILERLRGTPARVEDLVRGLSVEALTWHDGKGWSMQENIGHLMNVEELWLGRLEDYDSNVHTLRAADMSNRRTHEAKHNDQPAASILAGFRRERGRLVERLERLEPARFGQTALHPRLNKPMRIVDMMYFIAEHDDYHLARVAELRRQAPR